MENAVYAIGNLPFNLDTDLDNPECIHLNRRDLVGSYVGMSTIKIKNLLSQHVNRILILRNAHTIFRSRDDAFGEEAFYNLLWSIRENPDQHCIVFIGPPPELADSIFSLSPSLQRNYIGMCK